MKPAKIICSFVLLGMILFNVNSAFACTLWGAIGQATKDQTTLIVKNRDWTPNQQQYLEKFPAGKGKLSHMGICTASGARSIIKAGINEKGLVVITASASSIPDDIRTKDRTKKHLISEILATYESVSAVLDSKRIFRNSIPNIYMVADQRQIAYIEVGLDGRCVARSTSDGVLYHTNHFLEPEMAEFNLKTGKSSQIRCQRIGELLAGPSSGFTLDDFKRFSSDMAGGSDNSIFRTGSKPDSTRTMAVWIAALPQNAPPFLYVKLLNPGKPVKKFNFTLGKSFWQVNETRLGD